MSEETEEKVSLEDMKSNGLKFSLDLASIPVELNGANGVVIKAEIRELVGSQRDQYLTKLSGRMNYANGKVSGLKNYDGFQSHLLSLCLFNVESGKRFTDAEIQAFPSQVQNSLYDAASELSGLDNDAAEEVKND